MRHAILVSVLLITVLLSGCINDVPDLPGEIPDRPTSLEVSTAPGAEVLLDDQSRGTVPETGVLLIEGLEPGAHDLLIIAAGYYDHAERVSLREFRMNSIDVDLVSKADAFRTLELGVRREVGINEPFDATITLEQNGGVVYACNPEDFSQPEMDPSYFYGSFNSRSSMWWYVPETVRCDLSYIPREPYTVRVDVDGYEQVVTEADFTPRTENVELLEEVGRFMVTVERDWASSAAALELAPGECEGLYTNEDLACSNVTVYSLGTRDFTYQDVTTTYTEFMISMDVTNTGDKNYFVTGPTLLGIDGSSYSGIAGSDLLQPGQSDTIVEFATYTESFEERYLPVVHVHTLDRIDDDSYPQRQTFAFNPAFSNVYADLDLAAEECSISMITTERTLEATSWNECIAALEEQWIDDLAREECQRRPAFVGAWELSMGQIEYPMLVSCEGILQERTFDTICTGDALLTCEDATLRTLSNLGLESLMLEVANRFGSDVELIEARVYNTSSFHPWRYDIDELEPCEVLALDTTVLNGAIDTMELEFDLCSDIELREGSTWVPQKRYVIVFDAIVDGSPEEIEFEIYSDEWNQ